MIGTDVSSNKTVVCRMQSGDGEEIVGRRGSVEVEDEAEKRRHLDGGKRVCGVVYGSLEV